VAPAALTPGWGRGTGGKTAGAPRMRPERAIVI